MQIYNLIEYSSNYSETTGCLWFYLKNEGTSFNTDIANDNNFKSFKYKTKLLENTITDNANGILKNAASAVSLQYLRNFRTILEMPLINCKVDYDLKDLKDHITEMFSMSFPYSILSLFVFFCCFLYFSLAYCFHYLYANYRHLLLS